MSISSKDIVTFQQKILSFYERNRRRLPWRDTTDPYAILVSEIMLQQTQVDRVIPYYHRWLSRWPTVHALSTADRVDVLRAWMGLGYNNRVVRLHDTAKMIVKDFVGDVIDALKRGTLSGIGPYTRNAILAFSTNAPVAAVDTNIRRILLHEFHLSEETSDRVLATLAELCIPRGRSREWHNALMDYGALHLTSHKTGIAPKTRQSRFEGSDRQVRATILRHFLHTGTPQAVEDLEAATGTKRTRLAMILDDMVRDHLLTLSGERFTLAR